MKGKELNIIKKLYGEDFAHFCRASFATILEKEGLLTQLLTEKFAPTHSLFEDINKKQNSQEIFDELKNFIYYNANLNQSKRVVINKTPKQLMDEAGYILFDECQVEEDVQSFKKYYAKFEELCTFDGGRLNTHRVWFAVKKDVDKINRQDFESPLRQDRYGTSVISIQFSKGLFNSLSIKNRYNHSVLNPDSTFSNDLDNIIAGLSNAFEITYNLALSPTNKGVKLDNYTVTSDNKFFRENLKIDNISYCENNVIIVDGKAQKLNKDNLLLIDNYVVDFSKKSISLIDNSMDAFTKSFGKINSIELKKLISGERLLIFTNKENNKVKVNINKNNQIIGYSNKNLEIIENDFLSYSKCLKFIDIPNVKKIGNNFLQNNKVMLEFTALNLEEVGNNCFEFNFKLKNFITPKLKKVGHNFLFNNILINEINFENLEKWGSNFMQRNTKIKKPKNQENLIF